MAVFGPDLSKAKRRAKALVQDHVFTKMEAAGITPALQGMYAMKLSQAETVIAGGSSDLLTAEAELRDTTPEELAAKIKTQSSATNDFEVERMRLNIEIDAAGDMGAINAVLAPLDLRLLGLEL